MLTLPLPGDVVRFVADTAGSIDMLVALVLALGFASAALRTLVESLLGVGRRQSDDLTGAQASDEEELDAGETDDKSVERAVRGSREYRRREMIEEDRERQRQRDREEDDRREFAQRMLNDWQ